MSDRRGGRHRWSWFSDRASETKVVFWVGVATVVTGLLGAAATVVSGWPPSLAGTPSVPARTVAGGPSEVVLLPLTEIPVDLLLHEEDAARDPTAWTTYDIPIGFEMIQCRPFDLRTVPRTDLRVLHKQSPGESYFEALILYEDESAAAEVFGALRQAIQGCPRSPSTRVPGGTMRRTEHQLDDGWLPPGKYDESMFVSLTHYDGAGLVVAGGPRMVMTRRGTALVVYTVSNSTFTAPVPGDFALLANDTAKILPAMCKFDTPRCP